MRIGEASVCNLSKNTIWKQITTEIIVNKIRISLYAIYQRTQFESKSQQPRRLSSICFFCMQSIKEHNLKANHNEVRLAFISKRSVCNLSKNTIWKQITTLAAILTGNTLCMQSIKEHNLKANHNSGNACLCKAWSVCNLSKNTIWKQITTHIVGRCKPTSLYAIYQRTQFESKSQRIASMNLGEVICMQSIKEHNLKANHNSLVNLTR